MAGVDPQHAGSQPIAPAAPLVEEISPALDPEQALRRLAGLPHCVFLDSALREERLGRYSFLTADPFDFLQLPADGSDALGELATRLARFAHTAISCDELPPFQGGAAGVFAYDLNRSLERLSAPRFDEFRFPGLAIGFYDVVLAFDHAAQRCWLVSQGLPLAEPAARRRRAADRLRLFRQRLLAPGPPDRTPRHAYREAVAATSLAPQYPVPGERQVSSNFSPEGYHAAIERAVEYIFAGDVFQVNLAQRLLSPAREDSLSLYLRLRRGNPAPFAAYFDMGEFQLLSASPERFLRVRQRQVEARPIKGTRRRSRFPEADLFAADDLLACAKDRAENIMIVDLLRNDLSRVCRPESVRVADLCRLERYEFVQHLVSSVEGELENTRDVIDLLAAALPGGSITGAPKVRAMEIIAELEPTARGAYCGCLGYLGFDGSLDLNILIRTLTAGRGWWQFPVGGGIVAQSVPAQEYAETWHKAEGLLRALPSH